MPKTTTHLWRYANRRVKKDDERDYYAISIPPTYYEPFKGKELIVTQNGSSLIATISGCVLKNE